MKMMRTMVGQRKMKKIYLRCLLNGKEAKISWYHLRENVRVRMKALRRKRKVVV
jgi:hypothetical protein